MMVPIKASHYRLVISIPERIASNIKQVLDDLAKSQPGRSGAQFDAGVRLQSWTSRALAVLRR